MRWRSACGSSENKRFQSLSEEGGLPLPDLLTRSLERLRDRRLHLRLELDLRRATKTRLLLRLPCRRPVFPPPGPETGTSKRWREAERR